MDQRVVIKILTFTQTSEDGMMIWEKEGLWGVGVFLF